MGHCRVRYSNEILGMELESFELNVLDNFSWCPRRRGIQLKREEKAIESKGAEWIWLFSCCCGRTSDQGKAYDSPHEARIRIVGSQRMELAQFLLYGDSSQSYCRLAQGTSSGS